MKPPYCKRVLFDQLFHITKVREISNEGFKSDMVEIKDWRPNASKDFAYVVFLNDKTYLFILNNVEHTTRDKMSELSIK
jgi:hypothetical protein